MLTIQDIANHLKLTQIVGDKTMVISSIEIDSRKVVDGSLFVAIKGSLVDGHDFIEQAINKGCKAILCENLPTVLHDDVSYIVCDDSSEKLGLLADLFYDHPSTQTKVVAVTGTNGKTTVATLLYHLFRSLGYQCGLISTVENIINGTISPSTHTTPDAISLNKLLRQMVDAKCDYIFMEASSHAIHQNRIKGVRFEGVIFTNITHDHLDYHKTFSEYIKAKKKLFDEVNDDAWALTNKDDKNGLVMLQNTKAAKYSYSLQNISDFKTKIIECDFNGLLLNLDGIESWFKLTGKFNAYNLLAVYGAAILLGESKEEIIQHLSALNSVSGRFEYIVSATGINGIVDYAHTPDALKNVLDTINDIRSHNEKLITIVGCGGDRDTTKRPVMARVACESSSHVIFTSDNPRSEDPEVIINQMQEGVPAHLYKKTLKITDRKEAIKTAITMCGKGDIILVAGKGHETYQEIKGIKHPFDDKKTLIEQFNLLEK
ncbi:MAG: UDP-N-acetylmuramoyl-L-alanyl-D-glutamate--2,6-diaminopimelate ligase [Bacteroidetes bacterium]|nr:UDP-N-acetylmuramoyl-L-alanyl-D-glutamate--2,6-diaminopimelate ligase [Bacteroidota bacterium]